MVLHTCYVPGNTCLIHTDDTDVYATPKETEYQRCNFIIQIYQITIKIDKININLLFGFVKIVEFKISSHVFHVVYQEIRFLNQDAFFFKSRSKYVISTRV